MKVQISGYVVGYHFGFMPEGKITWTFNSHGVDEASPDIVHSHKHTIEVDVPDTINIVAAQVAALKAAKITALNEYVANVDKLNERLSKLQAIGCDSIAVVEVNAG